MNSRALVAASMLAAAGSAPVWAIGNGQVVDPSQYPYIAAVDVVTESGFDTIGSSVLIAPGWVLTAAHVVSTAAPGEGDYAVRFGDERYAISSIILPPEYDPNDAVPADLALLQLARDVDAIAPAMLLDHHAVGLTLSAEQISLAGYGLTAPNANDAGTLRIGAAAIDGAQDNHYFTEPGGAVAYVADSGGPSLLYDGRQDTVLGIHHAVLVEDVFDPSTHYNIDIVASDYRSFIDSHVAGVTWGETHYRTAQGPAQWAELVVTQGTGELRGDGVADGSLITLAGDGPATDPVGQWLVSAPTYQDDAAESWQIFFSNYDQSAGVALTINAALEYTVALSDVDWLGYDPIHGVPRSLLSDLATLTLFDADANVVYTGQIAVSLMDDEFLTATFRPSNLAPGLTGFASLMLSDIELVALPEPGTAALLVGGLALACRRRGLRI